MVAVDVVTKETSYVPMEILLKEDMLPKLQNIALRQVASVSKVSCPLIETYDVNSRQ